MSVHERFHRYRLMREGGGVTRFHSEPEPWIGSRQTVNQHSFNLALLILEIAPEPSWDKYQRLRMLIYALSHDLGEQISGDVPAPTKWGLGKYASEQLDRIESEAICTLGLPAEIPELEWAVVKCADMLEALFTATEQLMLGNVYAERVIRRLLVRNRKTLAMEITPEAKEILYSIMELINEIIDQKQGGILSTVKKMGLRELLETVDVRRVGGLSATPRNAGPAVSDTETS